MLTLLWAGAALGDPASQDEFHGFTGLYVPRGSVVVEGFSSPGSGRNEIRTDKGLGASPCPFRVWFKRFLGE